MVNEEQLADRVKYVHEKLKMNAIAEEYIDGRELYISILGHRRLDVFPIREMSFTKVPDNEPKIATYKAKWDEEYRKKWGISYDFANIPEDLTKKIFKTCKKAYKALNIDGYARFDCRLTKEKGRPRDANGLQTALCFACLAVRPAWPQPGVPS